MVAKKAGLKKLKQIGGNDKIMNITIVGMGYVGMSLAVLLARKHQIVMLDILQHKVDIVNSGRSTIADSDIDHYMSADVLNLQATTDVQLAYKNSDYVIIATPTDYSPATQSFDTASVEYVVKDVTAINPRAVMVIKSTVPVGFTARISAELNISNLLFSPEFLQEGQALRDNLYPSRIVVGEDSARGRLFGTMLAQASHTPEVRCLYINSTEAEAVKLFSNSYLAMRVAYFNELDTYAEVAGLNAKQIIEGVGLDPRIGMHYHNPSFGYGGYCLPKDTKQLQANFEGIPCSIIPAIVQANDTRKAHICSSILARNPSTVGVYRLAMKAGSDNHRFAAIFDIMGDLQQAGVEVIVYDDDIPTNEEVGYEKVANLAVFISRADVVIANRLDLAISSAGDKVYTRDIYHID